MRRADAVSEAVAMVAERGATLCRAPVRRLPPRASSGGDPTPRRRFASPPLTVFARAVLSARRNPLLDKDLAIAGKLAHGLP